MPEDRDQPQTEKQESRLLGYSAPRLSSPRTPEEGACIASGRDRSRPGFRGMHSLPLTNSLQESSPILPRLTSQRGRAVPRGAALTEARIKSENWVRKQSVRSRKAGRALEWG